MKSTQIQIRLSREQKNSIRRSAELANIDMSQWILDKIFSKPRARLLQILSTLAEVQHKKERRFVLNDLNAFLSGLDAAELKAAAAEPHGIELADLMDNYVAAMIEIAMASQKIGCPRWLSGQNVLAEPYFASDMPSLRVYLLLNSPSAFRKRNIFVDSSIGDLI